MSSNEEKDLNGQTVHLVARVKMGDKEAFDELYRLFYPRLVGVVRRQLGPKLRSKIETMDLMQTVWRDALGKMDNFNYQGVDSFMRWMATKLVRKIKDLADYYNAQKRDMNREMPMGDREVDGAPELPAQSPTPSQCAAAHDELDSLISMLKLLPDSQREVVVYHLREHMEFEEIAEKVGRTTGATRQLYYRGLKKLHDLKKS